MRRQRYSQDEVIQALRDTRGLLTLAARQLQCDRSTVDNYCQRYPRVRAALDHARAQQLDVAEGQLFKAIDRGELPAIMFFLRTIGRHRGYGDVVQVDAQVDLVTHPEWLRTRAAVLSALAPFAEAKLAVVGALRALASPPDGVDVVQTSAQNGGEADAG